MLTEQDTAPYPVSKRPPSANRLRESIVYVAPDCTDSAVKKRVHGMLRMGHDVVSFSYRRDRYNIGRTCDWENIELGKSQERRLTVRVISSIKAIVVMLRHRKLWKDATFMLARNLDLALLTVLVRTLTRCKTPIVYEILDIHPLLAGGGVKGAVARWLERRILKRCQLVVVSSPAFISKYFIGRQKYAGETFLLENKWAPTGVFSGKRKLSYEPFDGNRTSGEPHWTIGWFGNLRCRKSLEILMAVADALPDHVSIYLRGCESLLGENVLLQAIQGRPNMIFEGEYDAPDDLPKIYSHVHFNWCADFSDGPNSEWLLPNRIYEGGYFGIPAIAIDGHQTGSHVTSHKLGVTLKAPYARHLIEILTGLNGSDYASMRSRIENQPPGQFVGTDELARLIRIGTAKT